MFAALEVAEIHEALEQSRAANGEVTGPSPSKDVKGRASGHKPQAKVEAKGHRKRKGTQIPSLTGGPKGGMAGILAGGSLKNRQLAGRNAQLRVRLRKEKRELTWTGSHLRIFLRVSGKR